MIEIVPNWHPIFVHFTVALFSLSVLFFIIQRPLAQTEIGDNFLIFARYALFLGILFTVGTVIAGIDAFNTVKHDDPSHLAMKDHRLWAILTASVFLIAWIWSLYSLRSQDKAGWALIAILLAGTGLMLTTGHKGSLLVYYYGLGVESLPELDKHDHGAHDHDAGHEHKSEAENIDSHAHESDEELQHDAEASHGHGTLPEMESATQAQVPQQAHENEPHAHDAITSSENIQVESAPQEQVEIIKDVDGIVREKLPAEVIPTQSVEQ